MKLVRLLLANALPLDLAESFLFIGIKALRINACGVRQRKRWLLGIVIKSRLDCKNRG